MEITQSARKKLTAMLGDASGFRFIGYIGSCRGSKPLLERAAGVRHDEETVEGGGFVFFASPDDACRLREATIDYEGALLGRGLFMTMPHHDDCSCS